MKKDDKTKPVQQKATTTKPEGVSQPAPVTCKRLRVPIDPEYLTTASIATIAASVESVLGELFCTTIEHDEVPFAVIVFGESGDVNDYTCAGRPLASFMSSEFPHEVTVEDSVVPDLGALPKGSELMSAKELGKFLVGDDSEVALIQHTWDRLNLPSLASVLQVWEFQITQKIASIPEGAATETFLFSMLSDTVLAARLDRTEQRLWLVLQPDLSDGQFLHGSPTSDSVIEDAFQHFPWGVIGVPGSPIGISHIHANDQEQASRFFSIAGVNLSYSNADNFEALQELRSRSALHRNVFRTYLEEGQVAKVLEWIADVPAESDGVELDSDPGAGKVLLEFSVPATAALRTLRFHYSDLRNHVPEIAQVLHGADGVVKLVDFPESSTLELVLLATADVPSPLDYCDFTELRGDTTTGGEVE